jgi:hypothetical protein
MCHTNPVSTPRKQVNVLSLVLALGVALFAAPGSAAPPPAASSVTVYNCIVADSTKDKHLTVLFSSYDSTDGVKRIGYESSNLDSRPGVWKLDPGTDPTRPTSTWSSTASPSSVTLRCATSDGCVIRGQAEACGAFGVDNNSCDEEATSDTVSDTVTGAIEFSRAGFGLAIRTWIGVCPTQYCTGCTGS